VVKSRRRLRDVGARLLPVLLETPRLLLRPLVESDLDALSAVYASGDVARYLGGPRLTAEAVAGQVGHFAGIWRTRGYGQSAVVLRETADVIGRVGLHPWDDWDELELGWVIGAAWQRQGFASEAARAWLDWADRERPADHLIAVIHPDNRPSISLARSLGFTFSRVDHPPWNPAEIYARPTP